MHKRALLSGCAIAIALALPATAQEGGRPAFLEALCAAAEDGAVAFRTEKEAAERAALKARMCGSSTAETGSQSGAEEPRRPRFIRPVRRDVIGRNAPRELVATPIPRANPKPRQAEVTPREDRTLPSTAQPETTEDRVAKAREMLLQQLRLAAAQGIVQPTDRLTSTLANSLPERPKDVTEEADEPLGFRPLSPPASEPLIEEEAKEEPKPEMVAALPEQKPQEKAEATPKAEPEPPYAKPPRDEAAAETKVATTEKPEKQQKRISERHRAAGQAIRKVAAIARQRHHASRDAPPVTGPLAGLGGCPSDRLFNVALWAKGESYRDGLKKLRVKIGLAETPEEQETAALNLARHYIAHGAGLEARALLRAFDTYGDLPALLDDLAAVLDYDEAAPNGPLLRGSSCDGRAGLWRAIAIAHEKPREAIQGYRDAGDLINELSGPLRHIVGPRIARAALQSGDGAIADRLRLVLDRSPGNPTQEYELFKAEHAHALGALSRSRSMLLAIAEGRSAFGWEASMILAPRVLEEGLEDEATALIGALDALKLRLRDTDRGAAALEVAARITAYNGDIVSALERLDSESARRPGDAVYWNSVADELIRNALTAATVESSLDTLSALIDTAQRLEPSADGDQARAQFAKTLMMAGLPNLAEAMLPDDLVERSAEARAIRDEARKARAPKELAPFEGLDLAPLPKPETQPIADAQPQGAVRDAQDLLDALDREMGTLKEVLADG